MASSSSPPRALAHAGPFAGLIGLVRDIVGDIQSIAAVLLLAFAAVTGYQWVPGDMSARSRTLGLVGGAALVFAAPSILEAIQQAVQ